MGSKGQISHGGEHKYPHHTYFTSKELSYQKRTMAFKRPAPSQDGPSAKSSKTGGGEDGGNGGGSGPPALRTPIPRHIGLWSHTIALNCVSWEEIGNTVKWLPLHAFPQQFFYANEKQNLHLFQRWLRSCVGYQLHTPTAKMSNLQFLQDAISVTSGVPETTTAPTQAAYIIVFSPKNQSGEQFQIISHSTSTASLGWFKGAAKGLGNVDPTASQLVDLSTSSTITDTDFEALSYNVIVTSVFGVNKYCYPKMYSRSGPKGTYGNANNLDTDIGIRTMSASTNTSTGEYYRNYVKNSSHIKMLKHGDEYSWSIHNNCSDYILKNLGDVGVAIDDDSVTITQARALETAQYDQSFNHPGLDCYVNIPDLQEERVFIWPTKENPPFSRKQGESSIGLLNHFKENAKTLNHKFFILAPMKLPNGTLVKQRCSVMLEQKMEVTFWFRDDVRDMTNNDPEEGLPFDPYTGTEQLPWNLLRDQDYVLSPGTIFYDTNSAVQPLGEVGIKSFVQ